ncbi:glycosyltransferase family 4 protein [Nocardioides cavernaquae]|uniref:Glycosyltransferase WbuB n=1 Tax=Nocardioides cavernaquae TaxID=2321396 RepID=A0A3A5H3W0_9ACTN|nr:glycosyltransferase family 4 protein [Nocardioides cavernaquae]RJS45426.1 glycosyltransferase WbuB [Nocardioides cavernaquae]
MKILVHDHSGHPFQAELSRELARRGHEVTHSYVAGYVSGKGRLSAVPGESITYVGIGGDAKIEQGAYAKRLGREVLRGFQLVRHVRQVNPDVVMLSNVQIPTMVIFAAIMAVLRRPWILWHQDIYAIALRKLAGTKLSSKFRVVAWMFWQAERWCSRRAAAVVVIADSFVPVHELWGTADKTTVIPNWAPVDEITPRSRDNEWSALQGLTSKPRLVYSGTLGLKHNPHLLTRLAAAVSALGTEVDLVVVTAGAAEPVLRSDAAALGVDLTLLPFQPYESLPDVLGAGDVLVVLLEADAGAFSVPSKTLSYLCAGRPIIGFVPSENLAAQLIEETGGCVLSPEESSVAAGAEWVRDLLADPARAAQVGKASRALAEREFELSGCADRFEKILIAAAR